MPTETIIYGVFQDNLWRDEKTGKSIFRIKTKQSLFLEKMYQSKEIVRNRFTGADETWYTMVCDGSEISIPERRRDSPIKVRGYFLSDKTTQYSWTFKVSEIQESLVDKSIAVRYLSSDIFPRIMEKDAIRIVDSYGADIFNLVQRKDAVSLITSVTELDKEIAENLVKTVLQTTVERELFSFLSQVEIPYPYCVKAIKNYGVNALKKIKRNPYETGQKMGLTFSQCDAIAKACGYSSHSTGRIKMSCRSVMKEMETHGHIYTPLSQFTKRVGEKMSNAYFKGEILTSSILFFMKEEFGTGIFDHKRCIYNKQLYQAEKRIVRNILRLTLEKKSEPFHKDLILYAEKACNITYGWQQREAFSTVLSQRGVKIITGGPGTGKTTTLKGILLVYQRMHPNHIIKLCAPSGRAAQRMTESTGFTSVTLHRLLDYRPYSDEGPRKNADNPIQADLIVVDEMSMIDVKLFDYLLEAVKTGTSVVLVGDIYQLEAVGPGAVLHDLLKSSERIIQQSLLTEVFRQKGGSPIIDNSQRIKNGETNLIECDDFQIIHANSEEELLEVTKSLYQKLFDCEKPFETQVLCPSKNGLAGIDNLNKVFQNVLNPIGKSLTYGNSKYRINDKIIMIHNNPVADYYNGDVGIVKDIIEEGILAEIRDKEILLTKDMLDDIRLAYGLTIHKSQGSEFDTVIIVMPKKPSNMLVRNLFYTGVTRAKKKVYIINEDSAMQIAIKLDQSGHRRTLLGRLLLDVG